MPRLPGKLQQQAIGKSQRGTRAEECKRCRELVTEYELIGPVGKFGKFMIEGAIRDGEAALSSGIVVHMLAALQALRECA